MKPNKKLVLTYSAVAVFGLCLMVLGISARADTPRTSSWPSEVALPAGRKLVSVTWLCYQACEPWAVTRPMRQGESPETYSFTNGRENIVYRETAASR